MTRRILAALAALAVPGTVWHQRVDVDWTPTVVVPDTRHAEWCEACAYLPNLGVHPVRRPAP